ncbi:uncharacterized protein TNCV_3189111 [Trichonephila clavipes]|nr:uncharacterized protein TNCV_3189111 [Trichonephila clavipes]
MIEKHDEHETKGKNFQWLPKELHQLKYEAISVPQGSVRLVKKTQERKSSTCYLLITKGVTSSSPVPLKTRRERERTWEVERGKFYDPVRSLLKGKNQEINRLQLAVKLPWAIFFESVDILS